MQALTEKKPGESCTVKWMVTGARIAEWMEKHFSWISVEERLPESKEKVLVLNRMKHHDKYFVSENIYINGNLAAKSAMYYEEIAWMPIPSFDEILEANRDVLERIKEKGD